MLELFLFRFFRRNIMALLSVLKPKCLSFRSLSSRPNVLRRILVANRGEIAIRVIKTCRRLGIRSIAVFSTADAKALHVQSADEAYCIGPPAPQQSYLNQNKLIEICRKSGAEAVHPGYGFLSENAEFSDLCQSNNVVFIGPPGQAMRDMGLKSLSKQIMKKAGVPVIPGYHGDDQGDARLLKEAKRIGFPVMIKAIRGGGGKGMRIARTEDVFAGQLESARREAVNSFSDDVMLLERYIERPRHVEVQIFGDTHGNYVYLWERDCSVQRRHQKIIEEAPAPSISPETRKALGEAACAAAKAVGYVGAGTVEFILDADGETFYFMEMNTRLQVEHPVTEMITDQDLVEWQIRVAQGEPLPLGQNAVPFNGHAFEARIYAEDTTDGSFVPSAGPLHYLSFPKGHVQFISLGINKSAVCRVDSGVKQGDEVSVHYDPMIAKLIVWGPDRLAALRRLVAALSQTHIIGLPTNVKFLLKVATNKKFQDGDVHTDFIAEQKEKLFENATNPGATMTTTESLVQATIAMIVNEHLSLSRQHGPDNAASLAYGYRPNTNLKRNFIYSIGFDQQQQPRDVSVIVDYLSPTRFAMSSIDGGFSTVISIQSSSANPAGEMIISYARDDATILNYSAVIINGAIYLLQEGGVQSICVQVPRYYAILAAECGASGGGGGGGGLRVASPVSGVINRILANPGDFVRKGQPLVVVIAMKMEHVVRAPRDGRIQFVLSAPGETVLKDAELVAFEEEQGMATTTN